MEAIYGKTDAGNTIPLLLTSLVLFKKRTINTRQISIININNHKNHNMDNNYINSLLTDPEMFTIINVHLMKEDPFFFYSLSSLLKSYFNPTTELIINANETIINELENYNKKISKYDICIEFDTIRKIAIKTGFYIKYKKLRLEYAEKFTPILEEEFMELLKKNAQEKEIKIKEIEGVKSGYLLLKGFLINGANLRNTTLDNKIIFKLCEELPFNEKRPIDIINTALYNTQEFY